MSTTRVVPHVPHVLIIGVRDDPYAPPLIARAATCYATPTTVRVRLPAGHEEIRQQRHVFAVPDDAAWAELEASHAAFGAALAALAELLRRLGRYHDHLTRWGLKAAPNPLCPSVARIDDPDRRERSTWWMTAWHVPRMGRSPIVRHTPRMLSSGETGSYVFSQADCFVLVDDQDWADLEAAHAACASAAASVEALLARLGTYAAASDGRHAAAASMEALLAETPPSAFEAQALAVAAPPVEGVLVLTPTEARAAADAIKAAVDDLRVKIDQFDQGRGWQVLGYESFRAWAAAEIPDTSIRHVYRLRDANEVDRSLGVPAGTTPEAHARELKRVPVADRADVLQAADARAAAAGRERTAADVAAAAGRGRPVSTTGATNGHTAEDSAAEAAITLIEAVANRLDAGCASAADRDALDDAARVLAGQGYLSAELRIEQLRAALADVAERHADGALDGREGDASPLSLDEARQRNIYLHTPRGTIPADWDAWQARMRAIGGELTLGVHSRATGAYNERRLGTYSLPARWDGLTAEVEACERAHTSSFGVGAEPELVAALSRRDWGAARARIATMPQGAPRESWERMFSQARLVSDYLADGSRAAAQRTHDRVLDLGLRVALGAWFMEIPTDAPVADSDDSPVVVVDAQEVRYALVEDEEDGALISQVRAGPRPLVAQAAASLAEAIYYLDAGEAHRIDTTQLRELARAVSAASLFVGWRVLGEHLSRWADLADQVATTRLPQGREAV